MHEFLFVLAPHNANFLGPVPRTVVERRVFNSSFQELKPSKHQTFDTTDFMTRKRDVDQNRMTLRIQYATVWRRRKGFAKTPNLNEMQ